MRPNYSLHDIAYQRNRLKPDYSGWGKIDDSVEDLTWHSLRQREAFPQHGNLLELGCGAGQISIDFAKAGYNVTGIDISPTAIEWAIENAAKENVSVRFIQGDVLRLENIADESFDIALDGHCFHCIIGSDRQQFLQSVYRILKVGGTLTICSMCNQVPDNSHYQEYFDPSSRCLFYTDKKTPVRYIGDSNEIIQEVISAKFRVLDVKLIAPRHPEDLADLQLIAEKK
jgi:ubiquinone/menaquinone biosynthesis C-methylase UbiE